MRITSLLIVTFFCSMSTVNNRTFAQDSLSKMSVAIHYIPSFSFVNHKNQGNIDPSLYESIINDELQKFVNPVSLNVYYRASKKLEIQAGVGYQQMSHKTNVYKSQLTNDSLNSTQFFVSHHFISIPLSINYVFKSFFFGVGTDLNFHISSQEKQVSTVNDGIWISKTELNGIGIFNPFIRSTIGYKVKMGQKIFMSFAPSVAFAPSYLFKKNVSINRRYWQAGLLVGFEYRF